jgi:predicted ABC-type ATPase
VKDIIVIGGPNGAGKTTAAQVLLPEELELREFVNADEIARGLSPFNVEGVSMAAGRIMIDRMRYLIKAGESFAFETTCSGKQHAFWLRACKAEGWRIRLLYLWLPSVGMAIERVARRIRQGGHAIPPDVIARRYAAGVKNMLRLYLPLADSAAIYDNGDSGRTLIAIRDLDSPLVVNDTARWRMIEEMAR